MGPRNKIAPEKKFHKHSNWKGNDRTDPNSDPFFVSKKSKTQKLESTNKEPFFVSKKEKSDILPRKNTDGNKNFSRGNKFNVVDQSQGFLKKKSAEFDNKFKAGKIDKNKKTFDKKKWRLQKYSKKYKLEQWEDRRKKAVLREYYREIKDDQPKMDVQKIYEQYDSDDSEVDRNETSNAQNKRKKDNSDISKDKSENKRKNYVQHPDFVWTEENSDEDNGKQTTDKQKQKTHQFKKGIKEKPKNIAYKKAQSEFQRIQDEKKEKKEELIQKKAEKEKALLEYKKKKMEKFKKLNQKTKKGQPIMKNRIEMLLEKIQSS